MTISLIQPQPCTDPNCHGQHVPAERIALAVSLCSTRGVRLTKLRRQILELLWEIGRPTGAYELLETLKQKDSRQVGPPTVYRTLEFLMSQGLVAKIESQNAYVPCVHPERHHNCLFFICSICGASAELEDQRLDRLISANATLIGFRVYRRVTEVEGTCAHCVTNGAA